MSVFKEIIFSFYSREFYFQLARGKGIGMRFILMLTLLSTLVMGGLLLWGYMHYHYLLDQMPQWSNTLPAVTCKEGKLSIDRPVPYYIQLGKTGNAAWVVIDTTYKVTDLDVLSQFMKQNAIAALVTENKIISLKETRSEHGLDIRDIDAKQNFTVTRDDWHKYTGILIHTGIPAFIAFMIIFGAIGLFIGNLIFTFLNALVVLVIGLIMSVSLRFDDAMRLAAAYRIPYLVFSYLPYVVSGLWAHQGWFNWTVWLGYLCFAVWSARPRVISPGV